MRLLKWQKARVQGWLCRGGFWLTLLTYAALIVLSDLLTPKPDIEDAKPLGLGDFQFPTATEGRALPLIWGRVRIKGPNVIWYGDLTQDPIIEEIKTGLFSKEDVVRGYEYRIGIQFLLCQGPIDALYRVWIGDKQVKPNTALVDGATFTIDRPNLFGGNDLGNGGVEATVQLFAGSSTQAVSSYLAPFQQETTTLDTPAYKDACFLCPAATNFYVGNSTSIKPWSFEPERVPNGLSLATPTINSGDANPMNVIYEVMTDDEWGMSISTSDINTTNFAAAAAILLTEGNGFSFVLDRVEDIGDMVKRLERQIDGVVYFNPTTALWEVTLVRDDFTIGSVTALTASNCRVTRFNRGTWEGTKNQVRIQINERDDSYKSTSGFAQDMANVQIVGSNRSSSISHPGIKDKTLANKIAWRELRVLARPLATFTVECDRTFYATLPGDVLSFTDEDLNFTLLPVRVKDIDFGELLDGQITINLVEDVFQTPVASFGDPPDSGWEEPDDDLIAFPIAEQLAIEAPRALAFRDPDKVSATTDRLYCAARRNGNEVQILIRESHATPASTPDTTYEAAGTIVQFCLIGQLTNALTPGSTYPLSSLLLTATPSTAVEMVAAFPVVNGTDELGTDLLTLCYIDSTTSPEFILIESATAVSGVTLTNVFRGVLDTAQGTHSAGANVFMLFVGANISLTAQLAGDNVNVLLIPESATDVLAESSAIIIGLTPLQNRTRRPYPPSEFNLNGTRYDDTLVDLDGSGSGEDVGVLFDAINRRDHRTAEGGNEITALSNDAESATIGFTVLDFVLTHSLVCFNGTTELVETNIIAEITGTIRQLDILEALDTTTLPASLTFGVRAAHTFEGTTYDALFDTLVTSTLVSDFIGATAFGALSDSEESQGFTVTAATVDHVFTLSTALSFDVQYQLNNSATWIQLIAASGTSGTILAAALSTSDIIDIRHLDTGTGFQKLISMTVSSVVQAYGVIIP